ADAILLYHAMEPDEVAGHTWPVPWGDPQDMASLQKEGIAPVKLTLAKGRDGMRRGSWAMAFHYDQARFTEVGGPADTPHGHPPLHSVAPGGPQGGAAGGGAAGGAAAAIDADSTYYT